MTKARRPIKGIEVVPLPPPVTLDMPTGKRRLVRLQRLTGLGVLRLASGFRYGNGDEALRLGGSVIVPLDLLPELIRLLKEIAKR